MGDTQQLEVEAFVDADRETEAPQSGLSNRVFLRKMSRFAKTFAFLRIFFLFLAIEINSNKSKSI